MKEADFITEEAYSTALEEEITLSITEKIDHHPNYVTYVHDELKDLIGKQDGFKDKLQQAVSDETQESIQEQWNEQVDDVLAGGVTIHTALDSAKQRHVTEQVDAFLGDGELQAGVTMIDHREHEIIALSGCKQYQKFNFNRAYQAYNQPGSAIKPLLSFVPYLEFTGVSELSTIDASPFERSGFSPANFGGGVYGRVPIETAFKHSYNTAAVRMLDQIGIEKAFRYLEPFSFSRVSSQDYILPSALGTMDMSVLELTDAYTTFANDGQFKRARVIRSVKDRNGSVLYEWDDGSAEVW
nr:penicillin-binding transpeptidase domain-containing protein [Alteribacter populi]